MSSIFAQTELFHSEAEANRTRSPGQDENNYSPLVEHPSCQHHLEGPEVSAFEYNIENDLLNIIDDEPAQIKPE